MASPNIEIANDFFHDCLDFLHRYRLTGDAFYAIKSKRLKLFLDLRMAAECVLKAVIAYHLAPQTTRDSVICHVERFSHKICKLAADAQAQLEPETWSGIAPFIEALDALPVGLRYRLDGSDFRELNEEFYYATVGSDEWLDQLYSAVKLVADSLNVKLQSHSRVISGSELLKELLKPVHNKYAKKGKP
jgi:hypothetical protein